MSIKRGKIMRITLIQIFVFLGIISSQAIVLCSQRPQQTQRTKRGAASAKTAAQPKATRLRQAAARQKVAMQRGTRQQKTGAQRAAAPTAAKTNDFVFFWQVSDAVLAGKSKVVDKSCFSQWYPSEFKIYNITFYSTEQFMMYCKARCFNDNGNALAALETQDPQEVKKIGREITPFDPNAWEKVAPYFVQLGNAEKFRQNSLLKKYLLGTGNKILAEASPFDKVWGIGLKEDDPKAMDQSQWAGKNKLGVVLMKVREQLRKNDNPYQRLLTQAGQFTELITHIKTYGLQ